MKAIAKVNGREVYSDKRLTAIINTKVTFTDGSWVDVQTGQMVNKGKGFISLDTSEGGSAEKKTFGPKTFKVSSVNVSNLVATDVNISTWSGSEVEVTVNGVESIVDEIVVSQRGNEVSICGKGENGGDNGNIVVTNGSVHICGNTRGSVITRGLAFMGHNIHIGEINGSDEAENETRVLIKVPKGTAISVEDVEGKTVIGDTEGQVLINAMGGDVQIGKVASAQLSVKGSSDISVEEVNGYLTINVMGSGDVDVDGGQVSQLTVQLMGSGDVNFGGVAQSANLTQMGSGDIHVAKSVSRPIRSTMGSGKIKVGNW